MEDRHQEVLIDNGEADIPAYDGCPVHNGRS